MPYYIISTHIRWCSPFLCLLFATAHLTVVFILTAQGLCITEVPVKAIRQAWTQRGRTGCVHQHVWLLLCHCACMLTWDSVLLKCSAQHLQTNPKSLHPCYWPVKMQETNQLHIEEEEKTHLFPINKASSETLISLATETILVFKHLRGVES